MEIYTVSNQLIERPEDKLFFDSIAYKILRFNASGLKIMTIAKKLQPFTKEALFTHPLLIEHSKNDIGLFFDKCCANKLFIQT